jgi:N-dimethylarginine dimethylaminohydrolase
MLVIVQNPQEPPVPTFLVVDPAHFEVAYTINPWMNPGSWRVDPERMRKAARMGFNGLVNALRTAGAHVETAPGAPGAPDLVFPANAAVVLDGRAVMARFRHGERQVEEPLYRAAFERLQERGLLKALVMLPDGALQEGAGDFIWDASRRLFWAGYGPRSNRLGLEAVSAAFGQETVALELATAQFYHLDTCFCPLPGGEVLYYPPAFTPAGVAAIKARVAPDDLLEASDEDAARFCVNAVAWDRQIVMAEAADRLRGRLTERGYLVAEVNLSPFILSGGGAYCMTLRLDRRSAAPHALAAPVSPEAALEESL